MEVITSRLFNRFPNIKFGMSTRGGGVSPPPYDLNLSISVGDDRQNVHENRKRFFNLLNIRETNLAFPLQNHTARIQRVSSPGKYSNTDGLATDIPNVFLVITVADCTPIFIFDPVHGAVSAVHAGWKGTSTEITRKMIGLMISEWQTNPQDLHVFIGPAARSCCYEVDDDVASLFSEKYLTGKPNGKFLIDIPNVNIDQLISVGVKQENIEVDGRCTICNSELFHSYRRDKNRSGRMMGVIGIIESFEFNV